MIPSANELARRACEHAFARHRDVVRLDSEAIVFFGNDGIGDPKTEKERDLVRQWIAAQPDIVIRDEGEYDDYTWAIVAIGTCNEDDARDALMEAAREAGFGAIGYHASKHGLESIFGVRSDLPLEGDVVSDDFCVDGVKSYQPDEDESDESDEDDDADWWKHLGGGR